MRRKWTFDDDASGWDYADDVFEFTSEPAYARGVFSKGRDDRSGLLTIKLGGRDDDPVRGMSGGWTNGFRMEEAEELTLRFRYRIDQSEDYRRGEYVELRIEVDGAPVEVRGRPYLGRVKGDGAGGRDKDTGWRTVEIDLGELDAGRHEIVIGAYGNKKRSAESFTKIELDTISIEGPEARSKPVKLGAFEKEVLKLTNAFRKKHDLAPVEIEANLTAAAEDWSRDMARGDFYRHSKLPDQFERFGYEARGYGENIAAGYRTPKDVVDAWIDSPGHRRNMLRDDVEDIGIGYYHLRNDGGSVRYGHYWTQIFADPSNDYLG